MPLTPNKKYQKPVLFVSNHIIHLLSNGYGDINHIIHLLSNGYGDIKSGGD